MNINPRIITELHGNLPSDFDILKNHIYYNEGYSEFGTYVWIPRSSIINNSTIEPELTKIPIYLELKLRFEKYPEFDCITLSNT